ncbi:MAG: peptide-methionine (S)-S-oxide reductase MsrA, partial [Acidobacteriota bacterium]
MNRIVLLVLSGLVLLAWGFGRGGADRASKNPDAATAAAGVPEARTAIFAGGCFWCVESAFDGVPGVMEAVSGYTGGSLPRPTYRDVSSGQSGHVEAVRVRYGPDEIRYQDLLEIFWRQIDPTDAGGQFADRGSQY